MSLPFNGSVAHLGVTPDQAMKARAALDGADVVHVHEPLTQGLPTPPRGPREAVWW